MPRRLSPVTRAKNAIYSSRIYRSTNELLGRTESLKDLPYILEQAKSDLPLSQRIAWVESLLEWIRSGTKLHHEFDASTGQLHTVRIKFLLQLLERNAQWKSAAAKVLRSVIADTSSTFYPNRSRSRKRLLQRRSQQSTQQNSPSSTERRRLSRSLRPFF